MEKIPAACAMDWSIELEVGLRCGQVVEALEQIGPRLRRLSKEACMTEGMSKMFCLVRGEDRTFANTIILRLVDAFSSGDATVRAQIVTVFLQELRYIMKEGRNYNGILAKERVFDYKELLKRIKFVYDTGDVEAKILSLRLFGCWCVLVKDCCDVRHMILLSLQSTCAEVVKASLFAAGCICRLSEDFSIIIMGALDNIICSHALSTLKVSAARVFGKMQCSHVVINRAYKVARRLVQVLQFDEVTSAMLLSLTKLAARSIVLIHEQVDFLLSLLNHECQFINAMVLKCILFLFSRGGNYIPVKRSLFSALLHIVDNPHLQVDSHYNALCILWKIAISQKSFFWFNTSEFFKLTSALKNCASSSNLPNSFLALKLLVNILCKIKSGSSNHCITTSPSTLMSSEVPILRFDGNSLSNLASQVSILAIDKVSSSVMNANTVTDGLSLDAQSRGLECKMLLGLVLKLLEEYPQLFPMVLAHINSFIGELVGRSIPANKSILHPLSCRSNREVIDMSGDIHVKETCVKKRRLLCEAFAADEEYYASLSSEIVSYSCRFMIACLKVYSSYIATTFEALDNIRLFIECIKGSKFSELVQFEIFHMELLSCIMHHPLIIQTCKGLGSSQHEVQSNPLDLYWVQSEHMAIQFSKKVLNAKNSLALYKAGKLFACEGLWLAATYSFRKLVDFVVSESCTSWLQSLMLLASGESEAKLLLFPRISVTLINWLHTDNACEESWCETSEKLNQTSEESINLKNYGWSLTRIHKKIQLSNEKLASVKSMGNYFYFQTWFLYLRGRTFELVADIIRVLEFMLFDKDDNNFVGEEEKTRICSQVFLNNWQSLFTTLKFISCQLNKVAKEYDLLSASTPNIDVRSSSVLFELALGCSLLAFSASFIFLWPMESVDQIIKSKPIVFDKSSCSMPLQDLVERLWNVDFDSVSNLLNHFAVSSEYGEHQQSRAHLCTSNIAENMIQTCRSSILMICNLCQKSNQVQGKGFPTWIFEGIQVMCNIVKEWAELPFKTPKCFFKTRSCISIQIFLFNTDSRCPSSISVIQGMQLSLDVCVQLKRESASSPVPVISKVHCLLATSPSYCMSNSTQKEEKLRTSSYYSLETGLLVHLNDNLLLHMQEDSKLSSKNQNLGTDNNDWIIAYLCFEMNDTGQGFSTCLLDVSSFTEGIYQIYWHSCCVDGNGSIWSLPSPNAHFFSVNNLYNNI